MDMIADVRAMVGCHGDEPLTDALERLGRTLGRGHDETLTGVAQRVAKRVDSLEAERVRLVAQADRERSAAGHLVDGILGVLAGEGGRVAEAVAVVRSRIQRWELRPVAEAERAIRERLRESVAPLEVLAKAGTIGAPYAADALTSVRLAVASRSDLDSLASVSVWADDVGDALVGSIHAQGGGVDQTAALLAALVWLVDVTVAP